MKNKCNVRPLAQRASRAKLSFASLLCNNRLWLCPEAKRFDRHAQITFLQSFALYDAKRQGTNFLTTAKRSFVRREVLVSKRLSIKASPRIKEMHGLFVCEKKSVLEIVQQIKDTICKNQLIEDSTSIIVSISGGQDSIFLLFSLSFLQSKITFTFKMLWCNHFWQTDSFYTTLHLAMCALNFRRSLITFVPLFVFNRNLLTSYMQIENLRMRTNLLTNRRFVSRFVRLALNFGYPLTKQSFVRVLLCNDAKESFAYPSACPSKLSITSGDGIDLEDNKVIVPQRVRKWPCKAKQSFAMPKSLAVYKSSYKASLCTCKQSGANAKHTRRVVSQRTRIPKVIVFVRRFARSLPLANGLRPHIDRRPFVTSLQEALLRHAKTTFLQSEALMPLPCKGKDARLSSTNLLTNHRFVLVRRFVSDRSWLCYKACQRICKCKSPIYKQSFALRGRHQRFALANNFVVVRMTSETIARHWRHLTTERSGTFYTLDKTIYGHTLSDRVETITFNLIRGTGNMKSLLWKRKFSAFFYNRFFLSFQHLLHNTHFN